MSVKCEAYNFCHIVQSGLGGLFNLGQKGNFSFGRKEARLDRIGRKLSQMFFRESKFVLGEPVFIFKIAEEHGRVVGVERNHQA